MRNNKKATWLESMSKKKVVGNKVRAERMSISFKALQAYDKECSFYCKNDREIKDF